MAATKSRILDFLLIFAIVFIGYQLVMRMFFPDAGKPAPTGVVLTMEDASISQGANPVAVISNHTQTDLIVANHCPDVPFLAWKVDPADATKRTQLTGASEIGCEDVPVIAAGKSHKVSLGPWKYVLFEEPGIYEIELPAASGSVVPAGSESQYREGVIARFTVSEPNIIIKLFRSFITKPFLNLMIFIASIAPGHNLGIAIIVITLLVKLLLFIPTQHALEGQKKMQLLQPKLEALRKQYKDDPKKMQEETMKLWKEHKVNPFQACLPLLVQFPILIGLFYTIRDGENLALSQHLIYPFYQNLDWTFGTMFLGLDLTKTYVWLFPPLLVVMQFIQMKLTFHIADKKKAKQLKETTTPEVDTPQELQQKIMLYVLPLMIGFFAIKFPSAVSLYWGISTLFAIGQQMIVNREHIRP